MKINIKVSTGYVGSDNEDYIEIENGVVKLKNFTPKVEKEMYINEKAFEYMVENMIDWTWWNEEDE